jgi:hypothetical protein
MDITIYIEIYNLISNLGSLLIKKNFIKNFIKLDTKSDRAPLPKAPLNLPPATTPSSSQLFASAMNEEGLTPVKRSRTSRDA